MVVAVAVEGSNGLGSIVLKIKIRRLSLIFKNKTELVTKRASWAKIQQAK